MKRTIPVQPISGNWRHELTEALKADPSELRVIAPFIKRDVIGELLTLKPEKVRAITRFDLDDCASGASDLDALEALLDAGGGRSGASGACTPRSTCSARARQSSPRRT